MTPRQRDLVVVTVVWAFAVACAACDVPDRAAITVGPSSLVPSPPFNATLFPTPIPFIFLPQSRCPTTPPFTSDFQVVVDQRSSFDVLLQEVNVVFFDAVGLSSSVVFTDNDLVLLFGPTLVPAGVIRTFNFHAQFGCGLTALPRRLTLHSTIKDRTGTRHHLTLNAPLK